MDSIFVLQLAAIGLAGIWLYINVLPSIKKKEGEISNVSPQCRGRSMLISDDLPNLFAEILEVEDQGSGSFTLKLDDGFNKYERTYDEKEIAYLSLQQQLAGERAPVWTAKKVKQAMTQHQKDRILTLGYKGLRKEILEKISKGEETPVLKPEKEESEKEILTCKECGFEAKNEKGMLIHMKRMHKEIWEKYKKEK